MTDDQRAARTAQMDQWLAAWRDAAQAMQAALAEWATAMQPMVAAGLEVMRQFVTFYRQAYRDAGAPYGDTDAGFERWLDDLAELARLQRQVEAIQERQAFARACQELAQHRQKYYGTGLDKP